MSSSSSSSVVVARRRRAFRNFRDLSRGKRYARTRVHVSCQLPANLAVSRKTRRSSRSMNSFCRAASRHAASFPTSPRRAAEIRVRTTAVARNRQTRAVLGRPRLWSAVVGHVRRVSANFDWLTAVLRCGKNSNVTSCRVDVQRARDPRPEVTVNQPRFVRCKFQAADYLLTRLHRRRSLTRTGYSRQREREKKRDLISLRIWEIFMKIGLHVIILVCNTLASFVYLLFTYMIRRNTPCIASGNFSLGADRLDWESLARKGGWVNQGVGGLPTGWWGNIGREKQRKYDTTPQCKGWSIDADQNIATCLGQREPNRLLRRADARRSVTQLFV